MSWKIKLALIAAAILGPVMIVSGYREKQHLAALEKDGKTTVGMIESGNTSGLRRRSRSYHLTVHYKPEGAGQLLSKKFKVKKSFYNSVGSGGVVTQPTVRSVTCPVIPPTATLSTARTTTPRCSQSASS